MMEERYHATTQNMFYPDMVRTVSICVFMVKYDGREILCDYTEHVLSRYGEDCKHLCVQGEV